MPAFSGGTYLRRSSVKTEWSLQAPEGTARSARTRAELAWGEGER